MSTLRSYFRGILTVGALALAGTSMMACVEDKADELPKGAVDESSPPGAPTDLLDGKADGGTQFPVSIESAHPYTNNLTKTYTLALATVVPSCTQQVRLHFAALRTEANYDYVNLLNPEGVAVQELTGNHDGLWSDWIPVGSPKQVKIQLESDYSVTGYGFRVDAVDTLSGLRCPAPPTIMCDGVEFDVTQPTGTCACAGPRQCVDQPDVVIEHTIGGGFTGQVTGHRLVGRDGNNVKYLPGQPDEVITTGRVDVVAAQAVISEIINSGMLGRADVALTSNWNETFSITVQGVAHTFTRPQGSFSAADAALIARFEELFTCEGSGAPLTCYEGYACQADACVAEEICMCPAHYDPVCGENGTTYSNGCAAGCANAPVAHDGECGIAGDACGTLRGLECKDGFKCRFAASTYEYPFPDAGGSCVAGTYCDAVADCAALPHIAVPGTWACETNACAWKTGPAWSAVSGSRFATAHPYANNLATWKAINLPAGTSKMRLVKTGTFELESGYDYLEVWAWRNAAWTRLKRYTGTTAPAISEEFAGQYFQLKLVTDSSVTKHGFDVSAQSAY